MSTFGTWTHCTHEWMMAQASTFVRTPPHGFEETGTLTRQEFLRAAKKMVPRGWVLHEPDGAEAYLVIKSCHCAKRVDDDDGAGVHDDGDDFPSAAPARSPTLALSNTASLKPTADGATPVEGGPSDTAAGGGDDVFVPDLSASNARPPPPPRPGNPHAPNESGVGVPATAQPTPGAGGQHRHTWATTAAEEAALLERAISASLADGRGGRGGDGPPAEVARTHPSSEETTANADAALHHALVLSAADPAAAVRTDLVAAAPQSEAEAEAMLRDAIALSLAEAPSSPNRCGHAGGNALPSALAAAAVITPPRPPPPPPHGRLQEAPAVPPGDQLIQSPPCCPGGALSQRCGDSFVIVDAGLTSMSPGEGVRGVSGGSEGVDTAVRYDSVRSQRSQGDDFVLVHYPGEVASTGGYSEEPVVAGARDSASAAAVSVRVSIPTAAPAAGGAGSSGARPEPHRRYDPTCSPRHAGNDVGAPGMPFDLPAADDADGLVDDDDYDPAAAAAAGAGNADEDLACHRSYDVYITYHAYRSVPTAFFVGYDANGRALSQDEMLADVVDKHLATPIYFTETRTHLMHIHACNHATLLRRHAQARAVDYTLFTFLRLIQGIVPHIAFDCGPVLQEYDV